MKFFDFKDNKTKKYYKDKVVLLENISRSDNNGYSFLINNMLANYKLVNNNELSTKDMQVVLEPFEDTVEDIDLAQVKNKDIISSKVKALEGMEIKRPFSWHIIAINEEATTRREEKEFELLKQWVSSQIIEPVKMELEAKYEQELKGRELTEEEQQEIQQRIKEQVDAMTPDEVKEYMEREYDDPAEILASQILQFAIQEYRLKREFNKAWKDGIISGHEYFFTGMFGDRYINRKINPVNVVPDVNGFSEFIEDGDFVIARHKLPFTDIIKYFGSELSQNKIEELSDVNFGRKIFYEDNWEDDWDIDYDTEEKGIEVIHYQWKDVKPIKKVIRINEEGEEETFLADSLYQKNEELGDIDVETIWIPRVYEAFEIGGELYFTREVPGQTYDEELMWSPKLNYVGVRYDSQNAKPMSIVDRLKIYQYLYNIIWYHIEQRLATDNGKVLLLNMNMIPKGSLGMDFDKFMKYLLKNKIGFLNPNEEGNKVGDVSTAAKEIDMSLVADLKKYMELAMYIEQRAGESVGITKQIEGRIDKYESVANAQTSIIQSSNILETYFYVHDLFKRNALDRILQTIIYYFRKAGVRRLTYITDDETRQMINIDFDLLDNSIYGIYLSNNMKAFEVLQILQQLTHAMVQNQTAEISDLIGVLKADTLEEAEILLRKAEMKRQKREEQLEAMKQQLIKAEEEKEIKLMNIEHKNKMEEIELQEKLRTEREIQKQTIFSMGFNQDKDMDKDGVPDILEVAKFNKDAEIKTKKLSLEERKFLLEKEKFEFEKRQKQQNKNN